MTAGVINVLVLFPFAAVTVAYPVTQPWIVGVTVTAAWIVWKFIRGRYKDPALGK